MYFIKNGIKGYRKVFCYKGVVGRKDFFYWNVFQTIVLGITIFISFYLNAMLTSPPAIAADKHQIILAVIGIVIAIIVVVYSLLAGIALSARRLHDIGFSGWLQLIPVIAAFLLELIAPNCGYIIHLAFVLMLLFVSTKTENNKYRPAQHDTCPMTS